MDDLDFKIKQIAELILESNHMVALTGAGMGTESGIPDFRSPGTGLWEKVNPNEFASINSYVSNTGKNLKFMLEMGIQIFKTKPNEGHKALTKPKDWVNLKAFLLKTLMGFIKELKLRM